MKKIKTKLKISPYLKIKDYDEGYYRAYLDALSIITDFQLKIKQMTSKKVDNLLEYGYNLLDLIKEELKNEMDKNKGKVK